MPAFETSMASTYTVVDPDEVESVPFPESGIYHRRLTEALACEHMRITSVTLEPGQATAPHAHERQEEVYIAMSGGTVVVDGSSIELPAGGIVRFDAEAVRSVENHTEDETHEWLMLGAPPHGSVDDYGEYVMPEEHDE